MSLKSLINYRNKLKAQADKPHVELVMPGEPMLYSIKYQLGKRLHTAQFFRNRQWRSFLKCYFRSFNKTNMPVVVVVRFYVTPFKCANINKKSIKSDTKPAPRAFELCDYLLSFQEMIHTVLITSYRQIVKIDASKFYSNNPRTVCSIYSYDDYIQLQNNSPIHPKSKRVRADERLEEILQSECEGDAPGEGLCAEPDPIGSGITSLQGTTSSDSALSDASPRNPHQGKKKCTTPSPPHKET